MTAAERSISRCHMASRADTCRTPSRNATDVALSTLAPTADRHANATFSGVNGALRSIAASASGMNWWTGIISEA